ncbi:hypothetical protein DRJ24_00310 [Candidatus Acetothermia bacterium]|nr:MAG: hypothetical protein DRJ24_00310 [Candidatus Acetothermia bacterium]
MMKSVKERVLFRVFRIGRYHAWAVLAFLILLTGFGVYYIRDIPLRSSFLDLLPRDDPLINQYRENEQYLAQSNYVAILLTVPSDLPEEERKTTLLVAAERIAELLRQDPEFTDVRYLQQISPRIPDQYIHLFRLDQGEIEQIKESLRAAQETLAGRDTPALLPSGETLGAVYREISQRFNDALYSGGLSAGIDSPGLAEIKEDLVALKTLNDGVRHAIDGIDDLPKATAAVEALTSIFTPAADTETQREPSPFFSRDKTGLLITAQPRYPSGRGVAYSKLVMEKIEDAVSEADPEKLGVEVGITGTYAFNAETNVVINSDMLLTTIISSIGVFVILFLAFGSIFYSVIAIVPLLVSVVLTMSWAKLAVGGFNLVTTFLPALVLGLGIDYAIHIIARYSEERSKGSSLNRALYSAVLHKGEASFFAAATTCLVFVGLLTARSRALFEMGAITSIGVMIAFLVTLFLIPALITLAHHLLHFRHPEHVASHAARLSGFFRFVTGKARAIFVIVLVLTFFVTFQAAQTSFVFSSTDLVPHVESQDVMNDILEHFEGSPTGLGSFFTFYASTEAELKEIVSHLSENDLVEDIRSAEGILPVNLAEQQKMLNELNIENYVDQLGLLEESLDERSAISAQIRALLAQFALLQYGASLNGRVDIAMLSDEIGAQLRDIQLKINSLDAERAKNDVSSLRSALENLNANLEELRDLPPMETLLRDILLAYPEGIRTRYLTPGGEFIVQARVSERIFDDDNLEKFDEFASSFSDDHFGMPLASQRLETYMKRDFYISTLIAIALIIIVLWRSLRGWIRTLLAASPLVLGYIWMLGGMRLLSIDFNFLSIIISPLLIGIGVDNGIHVLHRTMEERALNPDGAIERGTSATAVAVIVTSLTTMLVFGSLLIARTPGLRLLGTSALLGIGFSLLFSFLFLPAALRVEGGRRV